MPRQDEPIAALGDIRLLTHNTATIQSGADRIEIAHDDDIEVVLYELQRRPHIIAVSGRVAKEHKLLALPLLRVLQR